MGRPDELVSKSSQQDHFRLSAHEIRQIEKALGWVDRFGRARLVMKNGRLCQIKVTRSSRVPAS